MRGATIKQAVPDNVLEDWSQRLQHIIQGSTLLDYDAKFSVPVIDVSPFNNQCLYRCLSLAMYGTVNFWERLKEEAISSVVENFSLLSLLLQDGRGYSYESSNAYREEMLHPNAMGTSIEAYALGLRHKFTVVVVHDNVPRQAIVDDPNYPVVTLFLSGSNLSGHFKLGLFFPEKLREQIFSESLNLPYVFDSPYIRTKFIPGVQYLEPVHLADPATPIKKSVQTPGVDKTASGSSSQRSPSSSTKKTPKSSSRRKNTDTSNDSTTPSKRRRSRTPGKSNNPESARKKLFDDEDEAAVDDPDEVEDDFTDPTVVVHKPGALDLHFDSDSDDGGIELEDAPDNVVERQVVRQKPWVALPPTDSSRPPWDLHKVGTSTAKSWRSGYVLGDEDWSQLEVHRLPPVDQVCRFCGALYRKTGLPSRCCKNGKVKMNDGAAFRVPSPFLQSLFSKETDRSKHFIENIRSYNRLFSTVFFKSRINSTQQGSYSYLEIQGKVTYDPMCYKSDSLENLALPGQVYFIEETLDRLDQRKMCNDRGYELDDEIIKYLEQYLQENNKFVQCFKTAREVMAAERRKAVAENRPVKSVYLAINPRPKARSGYRVVGERYPDIINNMLDNEFSRPCRDFVAAVYTGDISDINFDTFYVNREREPSDVFPKMIGSEATIDIQAYPLIHLHAEDSWLSTHGGRAESLGSYYSYRIQDRNEPFNVLLSSGKLFSQYLLDAAIKIEYNKLHYISNFQARLKATGYESLRNYINSEARRQGKTVGRFIVLNKSFKGSPRYRKDRFYAGMTLARYFGTPSYFITFTCNPKWPEIVEQLKPNMSYRERADVVVDVFDQKLRSLMSDLTSKQLFGEVSAYMVAIEFQKRGLPHAHILLIMAPNDKPKTSDEIDCVIQAEIPPASQAKYRNLVETHLVHSPCHLMDLNKSKPSCFADGVSCRFKYPKQFSEHSDLSGRRVVYKRPNNSATIKDKSTGRMVDNRNIVPHNRYLTERYATHVNVEHCKCDLKAFKYLCIYCNKNPDKAYMSITDQNRANESALYEWDEVSHYKEFRYFGPHEAMYTIWGLPIHHCSHSVMVLYFHLPDQQQVIFEEDEEEAALDNMFTTHLNAWFELNKSDASAHTLRYVDIPRHYNWDRKQHLWKKRSRGAVLGRLPTIIPTESNKETFALRCILANAEGATSFEELRTVNGVVYDTFVEAAVAIGLLENIDLVEDAFQEMCSVANPRQLRHSFVLILKHSCPSDPPAFYEKFKVHMSEDFAYRSHSLEVTDVHFQLALREIAKMLENYDLTLEYFGLPPLREEVLRDHVFESTASTQYDRAQVNAKIESFNEKQAEFFNAYSEALRGQSGNKLFMLLGEGGSGKTYVINTVIQDTVLAGHKIIASAYSGIAATLIINANTVHSTFGIPVNPADPSTAMSNIPTESVRARRLAEAEVLVIDEVSMVANWQLTLIDRFLRLLMKDGRPFGNKIVILAGDFHQTLPVVRKGGRYDIVAACIINNPLWNNFKLYQLSKNVRAQEDVKYSNFLTEVGNGKANVQGTPRIELDKNFYTPDINSLITNVFGTKGPIGETDASILTPINDTMNDVNEIVVKRVAGFERHYFSCSEFTPDQKKVAEFEMEYFPVTKEMVEAVQHGSLPPHKLTLRIGAMVMLLVNLSVSEGLCNGTRLKVVAFYDHSIKCKIMTGAKKGEVTYLFRVKLARDDTDFPGVVTRTQFPIRLAYAMTINKSQGQTLSRVGIYLPRPCFSHGQLYTALSRVRCSKDIFITLFQGTEQGYKKAFSRVSLLWTRNEVFYEVLTAVSNHPSLH